MKQGTWSITAGLLLIAAGLSVLLDTMGLLTAARLIWPALFAAGSAVFIAIFLRRHEHWWALIPGFVLAGLALVTLLGIVLPALAPRWGGPLFLLSIGAAFAAVFAADRAHWWALIPAGTMTTLACVAALPRELDGWPTAAVLFIGLAATFAALALVPVGARAGDQTPRRMGWPLIPAAILGVLGVVFAIPALPTLIPLEFAAPILLIAAGLGLMLYAYWHTAGRSRHTPRLGGDVSDRRPSPGRP